MRVLLSIAIAGAFAIAVFGTAAAANGGASVTGGGVADFPCSKTIYSVSAHLVNGSAQGIVTETFVSCGGLGHGHLTAKVDCLQVSGSLALLTARTIAASGSFANTIGDENTWAFADSGGSAPDRVGADESGGPCDFVPETRGAFYHGNVTVRAR
jgi:hypothetical protein